MKQPDFLQKPLDALSSKEWESLCDGCGLCCQHRANHPKTGEDMRTNIACKCLNLDTLQCNAYGTRLQEVSYCLELTPENVSTTQYLPKSCAYRLIAEDKPLYDWHHLICGDRQEVHRRGISKRTELIADTELVRWVKGGRKEEEALAVRFYPI